MRSLNETKNNTWAVKDRLLIINLNQGRLNKIRAGGAVFVLRANRRLFLLKLSSIPGGGGAIGEGRVT